MTDMNHVSLIGRLTADAKLEHVGVSSTAKLSFSLAENRSKKEGDQYVDEVSFFNVEYWGKGAEGIAPYMKKGEQRAVDGYLKQDRWNDNGQNMSKVYVVAINVQLLGSKSGGENTGNGTSGNVTSGVKTVGNTGGFPPPQNSQGYRPEDIPF